MKCEICNRGMADGVTLHRVNEKGVPGIWRCSEDLTKKQRAAIDPEVKKVVDAISRRR